MSMSNWLLAVVLGVALGWSLSLPGRSETASPPADERMSLVRQDGTGVIVVDDGSEGDDWFMVPGQAMANREGQAIAVVQDGRLICLLNPNR